MLGLIMDLTSCNASTRGQRVGFKKKKNGETKRAEVVYADGKQWEVTIQMYLVIKHEQKKMTLKLLIFTPWKKSERRLAAFYRASYSSTINCAFCWEAPGKES